MDNKFFPIPATDGRYEISRDGIVRNAQTKYILKPINHAYRLHLADGELLYRSKKQLLWEVFGITPQKFHMRSPIILCKDNQQFSFPNKSAAAKFLAPKIFFATSTILNWFWRRKTSFCGWHIIYQRAA